MRLSSFSTFLHLFHSFNLKHLTISILDMLLKSCFFFIKNENKFF